MTWLRMYGVESCLVLRRARFTVLYIPLGLKRSRWNTPIPKFHPEIKDPGPLVRRNDQSDRIKLGKRDPLGEVSFIFDRIGEYGNNNEKTIDVLAQCVHLWKVHKSFGEALVKQTTRARLYMRPILPTTSEINARKVNVACTTVVRILLNSLAKRFVPPNR